MKCNGILAKEYSVFHDNHKCTQLRLAVQSVQTSNDFFPDQQFTWQLADLGIAHGLHPPRLSKCQWEKPSAVTRQTPRTSIAETGFRNRKELVRRLKRWERVYKEDLARPALKCNAPTKRL